MSIFYMMKWNKFFRFFQRRAAFTLIELLAVVLIIGILTAVALPMYENATEHTRMVEAELALRKMADNISMALLGQVDIMNPSIVFEGLAGETAEGLSWQDKNFEFSFDGTPTALQLKGNYKLRLMSNIIRNVSSAVEEAPEQDGIWCFPLTEKGTSFCTAFSRHDSPSHCGEADCYLL